MTYAPDKTGGWSSVDVRDVHKTFAGVGALAGVSLLIEPGEFVTLLGPSGCGKTTLLRLIGGFMEPDSGTISVGGRLVGTAQSRNRPTRMVFQHYALFPHMTVGENVAFGLRMQGISRPDRDQRVRSALELVRLPGKVDAKPAELSGGQQQRVALARAIVTNPSVLLLDEPLAALDLQLRKSMQSELKNLQQSLGITFIYVTHDQGEALTMSDRIAVMSNGRIEQVGTGREVYDRPASRFVAGFIGEANLLPATVRGYAAGRMMVDIGSALSLTIPAAPGVVPGNAGFLMIRPEKIAIDPSPAAPIRLSGIVKDRTLLGALQRVSIMLKDSGPEVVVDGIELTEKGPGDLISIGWSDDAVRWLT